MRYKARLLSLIKSVARGSCCFKVVLFNLKCQKLKLKQFFSSALSIFPRTTVKTSITFLALVNVTIEEEEKNVCHSNI